MPNIARLPIAKQYHCAGFTLAELLVAVAIVIVLVAIAIPVFINATENAEKATCDANRRSVKAMVVNAYLSNQALHVNDDLVNTYAEALKKQNGDRNLCPSGGSYGSGSSNTVNEEVTVTVKCSIHGMGLDDEMYENIKGVFGDLTEYNQEPLKSQIIAALDLPPNTYLQDSHLREYYFKSHNLASWPKVTGVDGDASELYLQFKSINKDLGQLFLYAGPEKNASNGNPWRASYICDQGGLIGPPGQWYRLPELTGIATQNLEEMKGILEGNTGKVHLVNGKFVPAP